MTELSHNEQKKEKRAAELNIEWATRSVNIINQWMSSAQVSLDMIQYLLLGNAIHEGLESVYQDGKDSVDCSEVM